MTFNDDANVGGSKARRRGAGVAIAGGGVVGVGALAVLLLNLLTGGDFSALLGGSDASGQGDPIPACTTGAQANADDTCRLSAASVVIDQFWADRVDGYVRPGLTIVDGSTSSPCGTASNQTGPFYCPSDETVYIDPTFFALLRDRFGASGGELAQMYVLAHEYGHHVQNITGAMERHPADGTGATSNGVRTELQADCYAGAWIANAAQQTDPNGVHYLKTPTQAQIRDALNAAASVGDDHIQQEAGVGVNPESWTHGSSAQRERWFENGYDGGVVACDTFAVAGSSL
ncbi:MAG: neutral zinc metallopeptidase [Microbacterium sp.]|uniref:KPN_02809 family neutral zinc metallopeptidase n=1 Tax=Microbacterium sp. TaxID=51671 RepID=UPI00092CDE00|nr:neutral zinc metallopeptidase [Microbacterium sp.]MBN9171645.1 neutral zinc metallopeptidase [Microbacterium sp.]MBN9192441.1 neutral zinc metallopeptidase [Microbacterium sp.]OJU72267.1 MAG: neutral zinc metallopeptidase [Microbacterium sp. 70-38]